MDRAHIVLSDETIPCKSTINLEHQSTKLNREKIHRLYDYKLQLIHKYNLPSITYVITNIGDGNYAKCKITHEDIIRINYRVITDDKILERLNTLKEKINNSKTLTVTQSLDFVHVLLFAKIMLQKNTQK